MSRNERLNKICNAARDLYDTALIASVMRKELGGQARDDDAIDALIVELADVAGFVATPKADLSECAE